MRKFAVLLPVCIVLAGCVYAKVGVQMEPKVISSETQSRSFRHVVLFKWQPDITDADLEKIGAGLREMESKIPEVRTMEWGRNVPANARNQGYTHCLIVSFDTEADHDTYQAHPAHDTFRELLKPYRAEVLVVDFWVD